MRPLNMFKSCYLLHYGFWQKPGGSTKQRFITRTDWWLLGIKCGAYNHLERINRERWRQNEAARSTAAQSRARRGKLFMWAQWRYWGILTFLWGLHKMDKSFPSLNMLSILHKAPRHPLYNHRHPQCIRTLCKCCSIRKITTMEALYLRASILLLLLLFFTQLIPFVPCSSDPL